MLIAFSVYFLERSLPFHGSVQLTLCIRYTLCMSHTLQSKSESGQEARIVQIDFRAVFDRVNHQGILYSSALWVLEVLSCLY